MSEVLGDTDPDDDDLIDEDDEDDEFDDELDDLDRAHASSEWATTLTSPVALGIAALVLAIVSLIGLLPTYLLVNSIALAHPANNTIFDLRVSALVELGLALLAVLLAFLAHGAARIDPDLAAHRAARWMAGAALLLAIVSIVESGGSLLILLGAHAPGVSGG
jgi:ABC-type multidrug transport system fused ATPase/permease subunit